MTILLSLIGIYLGVTYGIPMVFAALVEYSHRKDVQKKKEFK